MKRFFQKTLNPAWFQGHGKKAPYFEGWYYKLISQDEKHLYAFIPAIFLNNDPNKNHAFIQTINGSTGNTTYHTFPVEQFSASQDKFDIRIAENQFTYNYLSVNIDDEQGTFQGKIELENTVPWPVKLTSPGVMGWYGWIPVMECYHGVLSMNHTLKGSLKINGNVVDFTGGRGYLEKDWGKSFPSGYIWQQSNHFEIEGTSLFASIAVIPLWGRTFPGYIIGLLHNETLYKFAEYTDAVVEKLSVTDTTVEWNIADKSYRLNMFSSRAKGGLLLGPAREDMHKRVDETLQATIKVQLTNRKNNEIIFEGTGRNAGLEIVGEIGTLLTS